MKDAQGHGSNARGVPSGASIEQERDGSWTVYRAGNPYATTGGFKTADDAARAARGEPTDKDARSWSGPIRRSQHSLLAICERPR